MPRTGLARDDVARDAASEIGYPAVTIGLLAERPASAPRPGTSTGGQGLVAGLDGADDAPADVAQLPGLSLGQRVEDQAADFLGVAGRGLGHLGLALAGQGRQGVPAVGRVGGDCCLAGAECGQAIAGLIEHPPPSLPPDLTD